MLQMKAYMITKTNDYQGHIMISKSWTNFSTHIFCNVILHCQTLPAVIYMSEVWF